MLELLQACRSTEGCDERLLAECISQGGIEVSWRHTQRLTQLDRLWVLLLVLCIYLAAQLGLMPEQQCVSASQALIDKVCDTSTDSTQLAQKLYDVLLLILGTVPATANILQRLQLALQRALQSGSNSLILAQLVLNLMQLPVVRKVSTCAAYDVE